MYFIVYVLYMLYNLILVHFTEVTRHNLGSIGT